MKRDPHKLRVPDHDFPPGFIHCIRCGKTFQQRDLGAECVTDSEIADREERAHMSRVYGRLRAQGILQ